MRAKRVEEVIQLIRDLCDRICDEPMATGEPAESVQLGRLQVIDEIRAILPDHEDHISQEVKMVPYPECKERCMEYYPDGDNPSDLCPDCGLQDHIADASKMVECPDCQGKGNKLWPDPITKQDWPIKCSACNGTGKVGE